MNKHFLLSVLTVWLCLGLLAPCALAPCALATEASGETLEVVETQSVSVALAVPAATADPANLPAYLDEALIQKHADFTSFAKSKIRSLNQNHNLSRSRMKIERQPDGSYRARYHAIDDGSLVCNVRRSSSNTIPFVGVLFYKEKVFEAVASSPDACRVAEFIPVAVIPNRHIFSFKQGSWQ
ncbi:hypothetical protein GKC30_09115 [Pseudodesulfovibrio sp. F-1]|uniref:Uncharacterized protein n=1 Tax=Pseudodesulfovibrio alkaliphilus TaxID=2661613 RepID=A0A7K1KPH0_9BACT|nr:hypothetical protein [Pseudodesulfovibrio alkaliphilus]MUM77792.1 hypothetical protein [Pseudodesulfovibrio alkaliphilus]